MTPANRLSMPVGMAWGVTEKAFFIGTCEVLTNRKILPAQRLSILDDLPLESAESINAPTLRNRQAFVEKLQKEIHHLYLIPHIFII